MTETLGYFAHCIEDAGNELVAAECLALTGMLPGDDGFVECDSIRRVGRSAYLRFGASCLARSETLSALLSMIAGLGLSAEAFRVEILVLPGGQAVPGSSTMTAVADMIEGGPQLVAPDRRFVVVSRRGGYWFGEILVSSDGGWQTHDEKPLRTSSSLPSRLCRAIVNLAVKPGDVVVNPCCGTGSFLLEAASLGAEAYGIDHNAKMVSMSRKNLAHFGYSVSVEEGEAGDWERLGDVLLVDLPYDRNCKTTDANVQEIIRSSLPLAPRAVFVAEIDLTGWLRAAGYSQITQYKVPKTPRFTRYIHSAQT